MTQLTQRYNERGTEAVPDQRGKTRPGPRPRVEAVAAELDAALRSSAPDGGLWTAPKVAAWIEQRTGEPVHETTAWRAMRRLGFTLQVPRPRHARAASEREQARFKKLKATAAALRRWHPADAVEVWGEDEARLGLKPVLRRVWAPKGERPRAATHPRYEWLWVFAAAHPRTGRVFWLVLPHLAAEMMQPFLDAFAREHAPPGKRVVLVVDGASAHRAKSLRVPERLTLVSCRPTRRN